MERISSLASIDLTRSVLYLSEDEMIARAERKGVDIEYLQKLENICIIRERISTNTEMCMIDFKTTHEDIQMMREIVNSAPIYTCKLIIDPSAQKATVSDVADYTTCSPKLKRHFRFPFKFQSPIYWK